MDTPLGILPLALRSITFLILKGFAGGLAAVAQGQDLLDGRYEGNGGNAELEIYVEGGAVVAALRGQGCLGEVQGMVLEGQQGVWGIVAGAGAEQCLLLFRPDGPLSDQVYQNPGCSYYHGIECRFAGYVRKAGR